MEHILYMSGACLLGILGTLGVMLFLAAWAYECWEKNTTLLTITRIEIFVLFEVATLLAAYQLTPAEYGYTVAIIVGLVALSIYSVIGVLNGFFGWWLEPPESVTPTSEHVMNGLLWPGFVLNSITHTPSR